MAQWKDKSGKIHDSYFTEAEMAKGKSKYNEMIAEKQEELELVKLSIEKEKQNIVKILKVNSEKLSKSDLDYKERLLALEADCQVKLKKTKEAEKEYKEIKARGVIEQAEVTASIISSRKFKEKYEKLNFSVSKRSNLLASLEDKVNKLNKELMVKDSELIAKEKIINKGLDSLQGQKETAENKMSEAIGKLSEATAAIKENERIKSELQGYKAKVDKDRNYNQKIEKTLYEHIEKNKVKEKELDALIKQQSDINIQNKAKEKDLLKKENDIKKETKRLNQLKEYVENLKSSI